MHSVAMYDVVVVGLGGMGSAVLAHCAMRGARVIGVDRFGPGHDFGASSGKTRIIRQAYYEDAAYVPLLLRAYELWRDLEVRTRTEVMRLTGLLMVGNERSEVIAGSSRAALEYDLPVEYLDTVTLRARYPALRILDDEVGVFEPQGGALFPERAVRAHLDLAADAGAELRWDTVVESWASDDDGVTVQIRGGTHIRARSLVLTLGPWFAAEMGEIGVPLSVQRNVQVWFEPRTGAYDARAFPAFLLDRGTLPAPLYGFPDFGDGVKAAFHGLGAFEDPTVLNREVDLERDVAPVAAALEQWMPGAAGSYREGKVCMYALTPDRHFIVETHPKHGNVVVCGGFSGHGFKFASVIGEIGADLALRGATRHEIGFLSSRRLRGV